MEQGKDAAAQKMEQGKNAVGQKAQGKQDFGQVMEGGTNVPGQPKKNVAPPTKVEQGAGKEMIHHPKNTNPEDRKDFKQYNKDGTVNKFHESRAEGEAKLDPNRDYATQTFQTSGAAQAVQN
ncbi:unnamed protein product [Strongylus vulgaris]|uniref:Uncharacterized protein n=1 Tax=Strongylus vulgaris TaxID=40348 RepID=A0A3P7IKR1_STRVU|nr:unnamed protein product [Strongylus vulgaris]